MRRFLVILGKNYVLFYRRWIPTLVIILLPLLLAFTLVYLRSKYTRSEISHPTYWDAFRLNIPSAELFPFAPRTLLYAPNVSFFNEVMRVMRSEVAVFTTGFPDASSLLNYLNVNSRRPKSIIGAVIFDRLSPTNGVTYSLRLPNAVDWSTRSLYPKFAVGTPRTLDKCASPPAYCHSSFLAIQSALDRALTNVLCGENLSMRHLSFVIVLGYLFPVLHAIRCVLLEKQQRMKETLKMLGMSSAVHWFTWIMAYLTLFALMSAALTGVLCISFFGGGPVLPLSNPFLIFLLLMLYALSLLSFGMVLTTLFDSPHTGTAISCAILIIIFLPFLLLDQHYSELNLALKLIPSFLPSVAMGFICMLIGHFEGAGLGVQFFNLFIPANPGDNLSVHVLCIVLLAQAAVCVAFTFYLDAVYPGTYGVPKPWYFPFTCLCRRRPTVSLLLEVNPDTGTNPDIAAPHSSSPQGAQNLFFESGVVPTSVNNNPSSGFSSFPSSSSPLFSDVDYDPSEVRRYFASEPLDLPVGISLRKLRKVYKVKQTTNVAVAGLTMNLFQGQITVLLGHNGAGKTTTLSILTGLYLPTSGTAFVNGHDIRTDIEGVRKSLGFCPQQDVYFEDLTVREHLIMVARSVQHVSSFTSAPYWLSNYLWDMLLFLIACGAMLAAFAFFNLDAFSVKSRLRLVAFLFLAYAWAVLPEMYLLARFFKSPTSGLVWLTVFNDFTAVLALLVAALLNHPLIRQQTLSYSLSYWCISISPTFAVSDAIFVLFENYEFRKICANPMIDILCYYIPTMPCCLKTCDPFCAYWTSNDISFDKGGIGFHLTAMVVQGFIFGFLVLFLDSVVALRLKLYVRSLCARLLMMCFACENCYSLSGASATNPLDEAEKALIVEDDDVSHHRHLVESMPLNRLKAQTSLALRRVTKVYGSIGPAVGTHLKPSVDRVSLAVLPGDCFGLLGVNGAGKTTMFRMITGDLDPSDGQILVNGFQLNRNLRDVSG
ncbi:unnamed protein product [Dicrocoelium dendriticum]|nr:unnamed protein product [Dicrocoelium dendriticum]